MAETEYPRAKYPLNPVLAGPYGHPWHPIAITIPIGTWIASAIFDIIALSTPDQAPYAIASRVLIAIGLVGAVAAILLGFMDYMRIPERTTVSREATFHMALNMAVCGAYAVQLPFRFTTETVPIGAFVTSVVCLLTLSISGWLGGKLSYRWGVRVATEATQAEGFRTD